LENFTRSPRWTVRKGETSVDQTPREGVAVDIALVRFETAEDAEDEAHDPKAHHQERSDTSDQRDEAQHHHHHIADGYRDLEIQRLLPLIVHNGTFVLLAQPDDEGAEKVRHPSEDVSEHPHGPFVGLRELALAEADRPHRWRRGHAVSGSRSRWR